MSLVDALLADLDSNDDIMGNKVTSEHLGVTSTKTWPIGATETEQGSEPCSILDVTKLFRSSRLKNTMDAIESYITQTSNDGIEDMERPLEAGSEYLLIGEANNISAKIVEEIGDIHKFARYIYSKRFPELETLVLQPLDYLMTARELGNDGLVTASANKKLFQILSQATIMVISVTASATQGEKLCERELKTIYEACNIALTLNDYRKKFSDYIESRMTYVAPNLSAIIGASSAAKLMGAAGGLSALSKMPSNHVALLGQETRASAGYSYSSTFPHTGFIYHSYLVQKLPRDFRRKVARIVGAKCSLAARVDRFHRSPKGDIGISFREQIVKTIANIQYPSSIKKVKALHAVPKVPKQRRGGRRVRKIKERFAVTRVRKQANRMNFGELREDIYQSDLGINLGNIDKNRIGCGIRMPQIDARTKVRMSQTLKKSLQTTHAWVGASTLQRRADVSGKSSRFAVTPLQGFEIVNPQVVEKRVCDLEAKYFLPYASFIKSKAFIKTNSKTLYN